MEFNDAYKKRDPKVSLFYIYKENYFRKSLLK